ncbi:MAG: hypothetical protein O4803_00870 [Trichodesmium sp. St15_bin1_1]|nr:hypothetical protein [Trichodesmium sp. St5_bin2_1]MDE5083804.1 hypothetical protein [Trichodesmium sp. St18_bin1]MDE5087559.1 hypothetical protein [Trichodesmium sp. St16_bin2-tuft]MDE5112860.1 hypothetical protein [Trichodesmium sp. St15_bin1_1]MDE5119360.1 hypothetical protein [Trichodesmium sp. St19_bin1]
MNIEITLSSEAIAEGCVTLYRYPPEPSHIIYRWVILNLESH